MNLVLMERIAAAYLGQPVKVHIQNLPGLWGLAWIDGGDLPHISLSQTVPKWRVAETFLHEVGHHKYGHVTVQSHKTAPLSVILDRTDDDDIKALVIAAADRKEDEADQFAAEELAKLKADHGDDIVDLFWRG